MSNDVMNRTRLIREHLDSLPWDDEVVYSNLDALDSERTDARNLSVTENSGESFYISYDSLNYMTYFLHNPRQAIEDLITLFPGPVEEAILEASSRVKNTRVKITVMDNVETLSSRQSLVQVAAGLNEIEGRGVCDLERYYVTPYIRLIRKNYGYFDLGYANLRGKGYFTVGNDMTKVIHSEEEANSATDW